MYQDLWMDVDTLVFDIDDTIYPVSSGFSDHRVDLTVSKFMVERLGISSAEEARALWKEYFARTHSTMKALTVADQEGRMPKAFVQDDLAAFWQDHCEYSQFLKPNPTFEQALEKLSANGLKLAILTNSPRMYALRCLDALNVRRFFPDKNVFTVQETWPACKPEAAAFQKVLRLWALVPAVLSCSRIP
jgi:putative hydrolase of the HAD superfamily